MASVRASPDAGTVPAQSNAQEGPGDTAPLSNVAIRESDLDVARRGAALLFVVLGVVFATWAARIPAVRDALHLDNAQLSLVLLCAGVGAISAYPLAAGLIARAGAAKAAMTSGIALATLLPVLAWAPDMATLGAAMVFMGMAQTSFNVSINAVGTQVERSAGRSLMAGLHARYCVGTLLGALAGSALAARACAVRPHLTATGLVLIVLVSVAYAWLRGLPDSAPAPRRLGWPTVRVAALGALCCCAAIAEGAITDWSGVYLRDQLRSSEGQAPLAFAAYSACMLAVRLRADRLKDVYGARRVVAVGAATAAAGLLLAAAALDVSATIAGFGLAGAGLAVVFPFIFSAAASAGPAGMAGVATLGYAGVLVGPPMIGFVAQGQGLQAAIGVIALIALAIAAGAVRARSLD